ncbi:3',5'-cyclic-AMP phosphodiesterase [Vibrio renipiscarius]|uniref:3',5'-cyclic adenosine monophosphate phosphodiesterase CpdA n=1 Tax=Vibrio renipiscarius TaxID=1461322 RepID=A0A0C2JPV7_9VIBR|nr:3',5'-cyclic-AMP phosphodiesterase [Vibrio renipiscarius]KII79927.1 3',5'-cyclic-nucleotide phosphodiesterase [Vibrio renipiscarius]KII80099.1 3',5'-cyclic-nucleotide phosphodiesterase [Vibrio renipiscarius]
MKVTSDSSVTDIIKLVQLTDTHLFAAEDGSLLSVNTNDSFSAVVEGIHQQGFDFEFLLATGDISQDHSEVSYQRFAQGIERLEKPCFWLPGNHDYKPSMGSVLPSPQIVQTESTLLGEHWQLILLDSQVEGVPHGRLSQQQLDLLDTQLRLHPERHSLVLLHHHPILVGSAWLDQHTLKDAEQFWQIVEKHDNVRAILCGHVHQDMQVVRSGATVMATPSTCVQFKPNSDDFALDACSPGWRELTLYADGRFETQVQRLADGLYLPNFDSSGY